MALGPKCQALSIPSCNNDNPNNPTSYYMNNRIQSLTSSQPTAGNYSHMDGKNMDGRWRGDGDGDDLPFNPRPNRVPEQELLVPELGFEEAAALCIFSGKTIAGSGIFRSDEVNKRKGRRQPSHHLARWDPGAVIIPKSKESL